MRNPAHKRASVPTTVSPSALRLEECRSLFADVEWAKRFPPILSVEQAAELMQVPKKTIYDWSSRGHLRNCSKKIGRHLRILRDRFVQFSFNEGIGSNEA